MASSRSSLSVPEVFKKLQHLLSCRNKLLQPASAAPWHLFHFILFLNLSCRKFFFTQLPFLICHLKFLNECDDCHLPCFEFYAWVGHWMPDVWMPSSVNGRSLSFGIFFPPTFHSLTWCDGVVLKLVHQNSYDWQSFRNSHQWILGSVQELAHRDIMILERKFAIFLQPKPKALKT